MAPQHCRGVTTEQRAEGRAARGKRSAAQAGGGRRQRRRQAHLAARRSGQPGQQLGGVCAPWSNYWGGRGPGRAAGQQDGGAGRPLGGAGLAVGAAAIPNEQLHAWRLPGSTIKESCNRWREQGQVDGFLASACRAFTLSKCDSRPSCRLQGAQVAPSVPLYLAQGNISPPSATSPHAHSPPSRTPLSPPARPTPVRGAAVRQQPCRVWHRRSPGGRWP